MTAPVLMNAVHIAWISLLRDEQITPLNIETAPLRLLADIMEAAARGEEDAAALAETALLRLAPHEGALGGFRIQSPKTGDAGAIQAPRRRATPRTYQSHLLAKWKAGNEIRLVPRGACPRCG